MRMRTHAVAAFLPGLLVLGALLIGAPATASAEGEIEKRRNHITQVVEKRRDAIVSIRTNRIVKRTWYDIWTHSRQEKLYERDGGLGSGAIFHPDGYVITNAHVISRASNIFVGIPKPGSNGNGNESVERKALPMAIDIEHDLAILRLLPDPTNPTAKYPYIPLGRSNDLKVGETIIAMGHPFRLGFTVTTGIVSGLGRSLELGGREFDDFMQVDAAINPGNSGGPLFDVTGRWIGVNTAIYNRAFGAEGIGFAIPADRVRSLIAKAFKRRVVTGDWLGVEFAAGKTGDAEVQHVYPKGPAARSGLRSGDVIVGIDDGPTATLYDLRMALVARPSGKPIRLLVKRNGRLLRGGPIRLELKPLPTERLSARHLGFTAQDTGDSDGVRVASIRAGGPAERMKLRQNDLIYGLGEWKIRNTEDLLMFLQFVEPGDLVDVKIQRRLRRGNQKYEGSMKAE
ncbi:MAG: trypsin-like peptidase domain-containing protein [Planctomycetota bacterium]|nr:trypsin-like peptidase domain-containing protein [Planctomycetota bacterium]